MTTIQEKHPLKPIAYIYNDFPEKFGIPRQSGIIASLKSTIIFEPEFRNPDALRGLEEFSHIWLIWQFSQSVRAHWSPTVRPPRLGGNERKGVFATRSPFRPNPLGLSCVTLDSIAYTSQHGPILHIGGADLMNQTPIYDIKPYIPYSDCHPEASGSFSEQHKQDRLDVYIPEECLAKISSDHLLSLYEILALDPRPAYQNDSSRIYGFFYANMEIKFYVKEHTATVCAVETIENISKQ